MFKTILAAAALLLGTIAHAERSVTEGHPSTGSSIFVSSMTTQVALGTPTTYQGVIPNVSLYVASTSVLGASGCVAYSTGSMVCTNFFGDGSNLSGITTGGSSGSNTWQLLNGNVDLVTSTNTVTIQSTMTIQGAKFSVGGSSFSVTGGSATLAYQFRPGSISLTGSTGTIVNTSSITATAFFGDGSHLTGISSSGGSNTWQLANGNVELVTATNTVTVQSSMTVQGTGFSVGGSTLVVKGGSVGIGTPGPQGPLEVEGGNSLFGVGASYSGALARIVSSVSGPTTYNNGNGGSNSLSLGTSGGNNTFSVIHFGDSAGAVWDSFIAVNKSSMVITGPNAVSPNISLLTNGNVGIGTTSPAEKLSIASGELLFDNGFGVFTKDVGGTERETILAQGTTVFYGDSNTTQHSFTSGVVLSASSVTASAFFGDGSHLTGIAAGGAFLPLSGGSMTGAIYVTSITANAESTFNITGSSFTSSGSAGTTIKVLGTNGSGGSGGLGGSIFITGGNGGIGPIAGTYGNLAGNINLTAGTDGTGHGAVFCNSTAPCVPSININGQVVLSSGIAATNMFGAGDALVANAGNFILDNNSNLTTTSSVTASAFFGDGSHLTGLSGSLTGGTAGYIPKWTGSTTLGLSNFWETSSSDTVLVPMAVSTGSFTVGGATLTVKGGNVGIGTLTPTEFFSNGNNSSLIIGDAFSGTNGMTIYGSTITSQSVNPLEIDGPHGAPSASNAGPPFAPINIVGTSALQLNHSQFCSGGNCVGLAGAVNITAGKGETHTTSSGSTWAGTNGANLNLSGGPPNSANGITNQEGLVVVQTSATFNHSVTMSSSVVFANGVANIGIIWADGTVSTTAPTGSGGAIYGADEVSIHKNGSNIFSALSSSVTLQGNAFNGTSQLIKTNGSGQYPAIDGSLITNVVTPTGTQTLINKRITKRVTTASDATSITPNSDNVDMTYQSNTQALGTLTINADAGTPTNGQAWLLKIKSTNVQTFAWNAVFVGGTVALPTVTTGGGKIDNWAFIYDSVNSVWEFTGSAGGF